jgi:predicted DNA-binding protein
MPKTFSFDLADELADKLASLARQQGKPVNSLLVDIVSEYLEVTEFILRKG